MPKERRGEKRPADVIRNAILILQNLHYHVGLEPSPEEHIFIVGPPRSGTTLVRQMLLAHPLLTGPDKETFFFLRWNLRDFALDEIPPAQMEQIRTETLTSIRLFDAIARWLKHVNRARAFVEKSPQHALRLPFLQRYFPRSRFVFVYRDPRDGFISAKRNRHMKWMTADTYAELWRDCVMMRIEQEHSTRIFDLRYEDLCAAPERHLQSMMKFLGYDSVPEQLSPQRYSVTALAQRPGHARLNQSIRSDTVGEWRRALPAEQRAHLERIAGPQMTVLRYMLGTPFQAASQDNLGLSQTHQGLGVLGGVSEDRSVELLAALRASRLERRRRLLAHLLNGLARLDP